MGAGSGHPRVRLAELVAALSLGVDLGFGQPMEHVLRQCLIALRLVDHAGLDEQDRMAVYYTALLVNVGCHADAHEQAKWFGDDIALKSGKYAHEFGSVRGALASMRLVGAGNPRCTGSGSDSSSPGPGIASSTACCRSTRSWRGRWLSNLTFRTRCVRRSVRRTSSGTAGLAR